MSIYIDKILSTIPKEEHKLNEYLQYITQKDIVKYSESLYSDVASIVCEYLYLHPVTPSLIKFRTIEQMGGAVPVLIYLDSISFGKESLEIHYDYLREMGTPFVFRNIKYTHNNIKINLTFRESKFNIYRWYTMNIRELETNDGEHTTFILNDKRDPILYDVDKSPDLYIKRNVLNFTGKHFDFNKLVYIIDHIENISSHILRKVLPYIHRLYELCQCFNIPFHELS